jgi:isopentenyl phosphate kinase
MLVFVKLGGSLITDKRQASSFRAERMTGLARAINDARTQNPSLRMVLGHGSGSFGHFAAKKHGTMQGVSSDAQWYGFAEVSRAAAQLNRLVADALGTVGMPVWVLQPSASAECAGGALRHLATRPVLVALQRGLVPLVYGDVALDSVQGGTIISTETIFFYLAPILVPRHIFLLGEVEGVLDERERVIPVITPESLPEVEAALGGSGGVDVTGGMASKVRGMVQLAQAIRGLRIHICSGVDPNSVRDALLNPDSGPGTVISAG